MSGLTAVRSGEGRVKPPPPQENRKPSAGSDLRKGGGEGQTPYTNFPLSYVFMRTSAATSSQRRRTEKSCPLFLSFYFFFTQRSHPPGAIRYYLQHQDPLTPPPCLSLFFSLLHKDLSCSGARCHKTRLP